MVLQPFEAGRFADGFILVMNPNSRKQDLFTDEEFEIIRFIKYNERETLLALLLPNIGIARKSHIVICLKVVSKLRKLGLLDLESITGRASDDSSTTASTEIEGERLGAELRAARPLAALLFKLSSKALGILGPTALLGLVVALAASSLAFFPAGLAFSEFKTGAVSYFWLILVLIFSATFSLSFRSLMQAAFVSSYGREIFESRLSFLGPIPVLDFDHEQINLEGVSGRARFRILGLLSPLALGAVSAVLLHFGLISGAIGFAAFAGSVLATLILASPFLRLDFSDLMQLYLRPHEWKMRLAADIRSVFSAKGSLGRDVIIGCALSLVWLFFWQDSLRLFWTALSSQVVQDVFGGAGIERTLGAWLVVACLLGAIVFPVFVFLISFLRGNRARKILSIKKDSIKESLNFEERMAALEKIPLFTYLQDQERLALLNEMTPAFFPEGEYIVHQGELGQDFFVLVRGQASAYFTDLKGKSIYLAGLKEGDAFGEISLIDDVPRTASIVSDGGCILLVLNKSGFDRFCTSLGSPDRVKALIRLTSFFRRHPLFSKLPARDQAALIDCFRFLTLTPGDEVLDSEESFHLVFSGKIRADTGDDLADVFLDPDDCFGYTNALNARFYAVEGTGILSVKKEEFYSLIWEKLVEHPELYI
jgi:hypothetical protein